MSDPAPRRLTLPDGRSLAFAEYGDRGGFPLVLCHGTPGSRFQRHPDDGLAVQARARVIVPERPGYGGSSPADPAPAAASGDDLSALADHLELPRFAIAGVSGGAPYALAGARRLGARVTRVAIASGVAPDLLAHRLHLFPRLAFRLAKAASGRWPEWPAAFARRHPFAYLRALSWQADGADRRTLGRARVKHLLAQDVAAALAQGMAGVRRDLAALAGDWGFLPGEITAPVTLWHGDADSIVPYSCASRLAEGIPSARLIRVPGGGHFMVFEMWPAILAWLVAEHWGDARP